MRMRWLHTWWTSLGVTPDQTLIEQFDALMALTEPAYPGLRWRLGKPQTIEEWRKRHCA